MSKNLRKFTSNEAYNQYKATDGWDYPSVCFVQTNTQYEVHYNKEFIMRWSTADSSKVPVFLGDISHDEFKAWVDKASRVCEIKKDGTDFAYLYSDKNNNYNVLDYTKREDGTANSHYNTEDKADYLQMAEIQNVNVGLFENQIEGWTEVRFDWDSGCPAGFHKWFPNSKSGTKLFGRYDIMPNDTTGGIDICYGQSQSGSFTWSASTILSRTKATNANLLEMTYWEHLVMTYIFCAYYKTFNTQSIFGGLQSGSEAIARAYENGSVDTILTHNGGKDVTISSTTNKAYKFLHLENPIYGKQWIWGAGWLGDSTAASGTELTTGKYWMTYDDIKANARATMYASDADVKGIYPCGSSVSQKYFKEIDLWGVPQDISGSSASGFYDGFWAFELYSSRVAYLGGNSSCGAIDGGFARYFYADASASNWYRRGRSTMNR